MTRAARSSPPAPGGALARLAHGVATALRLAASAHPRLALALGTLVLAAGLLPAAIAWLSKLIIDEVVLAAGGGHPEAVRQALVLVGLEGLALLAMTGCEHGQAACRDLLRPLLTQHIQARVLAKALELGLPDFEDSSLYDRLNQLRKGAAERPGQLVLRTATALRYALLLAAYAALLWRFSAWVVPCLALASLPAFATEARFANLGFELFRWRSVPQRRREYLETVLAREDFVKEVKLFGLADPLLALWRRLFGEIFRRERRYVVRKESWGFAASTLATALFYAIYGWIVYAAATGRVSVGDMALYLVVFREGQQALTQLLVAVGGIYDDQLYLEQLDAFVRQPVDTRTGAAESGLVPHAGLAFEDVWFTYPGAAEPALRGVSFHLRPGETLALVGENGSGKTTLIKLLTRLYRPERGRILLDGRDLEEWGEAALYRRLGVIFQDFVRYQMSAGENIGLGDVAAWEDRARWRQAARRGLAEPVIADLPKGYDTQLGRWFDDGQELSGGEWQKIALSRLFMRRDADILILDEPTAAMDAEAEAALYGHFQAESRSRTRMTILISHRFSTIRRADHIVLLKEGAVAEEGDHDVLMHLGGRYAELFTLQAAGYR